jgi:hypothetical protein
VLDSSRWHKSPIKILDKHSHKRSANEADTAQWESAMSKRFTLRKVLLGIASLTALLIGAPIWPIFSIVAAMDRHFDLTTIIVLMIVWSAASLVTFGVAMYFIYLVYHNEALQAEQKVIWTMLLIFFWPVMPVIYWYNYIWKEPQADQSPQGG